MDLTLLPLADPSTITNIQDKASAAHTLSRTLALGLFTTRQKYNVTAMVMRTARREMVHPTIEMISNAFLSALPIWGFN